MGFQLGANLLDMCVLSILEKEDAYGYVLTHTMKQAMAISESTLYPVLRRLQKDKSLETYDQPYQGRNRRYYKLTEKGKAALTNHKQEWSEYKQKIDQIVYGGENYE